MKHDFNQKNGMEMAYPHAEKSVCSKLFKSLLRTPSLQEKILVDKVDLLELLDNLKKLRLLHSISIELLREDEVQSLYEKFMDAALAIMNADFATMQLLVTTADGEKLRLLASRGFDQETIKNWEWVDGSSGRTSCAEALLTGKRVLISDVEKHGPLRGTAELENYRRAGSRASLSTPLYSRSGKMLGMISTHWKSPYRPSENQYGMFDVIAREAADLIERKLTEEKLVIKKQKLEKKCEQLAHLKQVAAEALKAKSEFLANMSHEIKTPLNGIIGMVDLLMMSDLNASQKKMVTAIKHSSLRLLELIRNLLELSEIDELELKQETLDFWAFLDEKQALYAELAKKKGLEFRFERDVPRRIVADKLRLGQILDNLVGNALKFTEKGWIELTARKLKSEGNRAEILIAVTDTGIGIREEEFPKIFDYFTQADDTASKKYQGAGLGLPIAKNLAKHMGGDVFVESESGKGSTFRFVFVSEEESGVPRILLVEDDRVNQNVIALFCEHLGWDIEIAGDGISALEILKEKEKDIVLLDIQLPGMNGFEVAKSIRKKLGNEVPIIAATAYADADTEKKCYAAGMDEFLTKPLDLSVLKDSVLRWFSSGRNAETKFN